MNIKDVKKAIAKYHKENYDLAISDQSTRTNYIEFFESILESLGEINDTLDNVDNLKTYIEKKYDFIDTLESVLSSIETNTPVSEEEVSIVSHVLTTEQKQLIKDRIPEEFKNPLKKSKFILTQTPKYSDAPVDHNKKKKIINDAEPPDAEPHVIPFKQPKVKVVKIKVKMTDAKKKIAKAVPKVKEPCVIPFKEPKVKIVKVKVAGAKVKEPKIKIPKVKEPRVIPFKEPKVKIVKVKVAGAKVKEPKIKIAKVKEPRVIPFKQPKVKVVKIAKAGAKFKIKMTDAEKKIAKAVAMKKYRQKLKDENPKLFLNKQRDEKRVQRASRKIKIIAAPQEIPLELLIDHVNPKQTVGTAKNVADLKFLRKYFLS
jgi:hypothetical protein